MGYLLLPAQALPLLSCSVMINGNRPFNEHKAKLNYAFYQPTTLWGERLPMVENNKL
jgi:hypothetical protein